MEFFATEKIQKPFLRANRGICDSGHFDVFDETLGGVVYAPKIKK